MWKVIYIVQKEEHAQRLQQILTESGFWVKVKSSGGKHNKAFEICVPFSEAEDAYEVLCEHKFQG